MKIDGQRGRVLKGEGCTFLESFCFFGFEMRGCWVHCAFFVFSHAG